MLFLCTISGVLCLVYYLSMEDVKFFSSSSNNTKYEDLEKINKLYKEKVLTKEEYEAEKERILNNK